MLETVAIIGPARFGVPLTQALTAPMLGRLARPRRRLLATAGGLRRCPPAPQRRHHGLLHLGDRRWPRRLRGHLRRDRPADRHRGGHRGRGGAHVGEPARAGLVSRARCRCWSTGVGCAPGTTPRARGARADARSRIGAEIATMPAPPGQLRPPGDHPQCRRCLRAAAREHGVGAPAAVAAWLAVAWLVSRPDSAPLPAGAAFAAILAGGAFLFALGGGLGLDAALRRALRAALLVFAATWLRAAPRAPRASARCRRRALGRLRRIPARPRPPSCSTDRLRRAASPQPPARSRTRSGTSHPSPGPAPRRRAHLGGHRVGNFKPAAPGGPPRVQGRSTSSDRIGGRAGFAGHRLGGRARRDQQVVEERRRQPRLEQRRSSACSAR